MDTKCFKRKYIIPTLLLLLLLRLIVSAVSIKNYAEQSEEQSADAIIVLGAAVTNSEPSPVFRERINHAINLYTGDYAPVIIFTGGVGEGKSISEAEAAAIYAVAQGIPQNAILLDTLSRTTGENLEYAHELMINSSIEEVIIVSDPLHMKRAVLMASDRGMVVYSSPTPTSLYRSWKTKSQFLFRELYYYNRYLLIRILH